MTKKEETKTEEKAEPKVEDVVVKELPSQQVRRVEGEDGKNYNLLTTEEALKEILEKVRLITKAVN